MKKMYVTHTYNSTPIYPQSQYLNKNVTTICTAYRKSNRFLGWTCKTLHSIHGEWLGVKTQSHLSLSFFHTWLGANVIKLFEITHFGANQISNNYLRLLKILNCLCSSQLQIGLVASPWQTPSHNPQSQITTLANLEKAASHQRRTCSFAHFPLASWRHVVQMPKFDA